MVDVTEWQYFLFASGRNTRGSLALNWLMVELAIFKGFHRGMIILPVITT